MKRLILIVLLFVGMTAMAQTRVERGTYALQTDTIIAYRVLTGNSLAASINLSGLTGTSVKVELVGANDLDSDTPRTLPGNTEFLVLDSALTHTITANGMYGFWVDTQVPYDYVGLKFTFTDVTASSFKWKINLKK